MWWPPWAEFSIRPSAAGLLVKNNTLSNMTGRGITVYAGEYVVIEDNRIDNIMSGAIELDHYTQGVVQRNCITNILRSAI